VDARPSFTVLIASCAVLTLLSTGIVVESSATQGPHDVNLANGDVDMTIWNSIAAGEGYGGDPVGDAMPNQDVTVFKTTDNGTWTFFFFDYDATPTGRFVIYLQIETVNNYRLNFNYSNGTLWTDTLSGPVAPPLDAANSGLELGTDANMDKIEMGIDLVALGIGGQGSEFTALSWNTYAPDEPIFPEDAPDSAIPPYTMYSPPVETTPPEIHDVLIDGAASKTYELSAGLPATVTLTATIDDTNTGGSNISGANYTLGSFNWPTAQSMIAVDGAWNDHTTETVTAAIVTPTVAGVYSHCVYGWDEAPNHNTTSTACATLTIVDDLPPEISNVLVDGLTSVTVSAGTNVFLNATVDDSSTGHSNIEGANYTIGPANWSSSTPMDAVTPPFDSSTEDVTSRIDTTGWTTNTYTICVYARDAVPNNNTTAAGCISIVMSPSDTTPPGDSEVNAIFWWVLLISLVALSLILVPILLARRRKKEELIETEEETEEMTPRP
jgi:hypothetical protein